MNATNELMLEKMNNLMLRVSPLGLKLVFEILENKLRTVCWTTPIIRVCLWLEY